MFRLHETRLQISIAAIVAAFAVVLAACGGEERAEAVDEPGRTTTKPPSIDYAKIHQPVIFELEDHDQAGTVGSVALAAVSERKTAVSILLRDRDGEMVAHLHASTCDTLKRGDTIALEKVVEGRSTSTVEKPLVELVESDFVVDLHEAYGHADRLPVACGAVPERSEVDALAK